MNIIKIANDLRDYMFLKEAGFTKSVKDISEIAHLAGKAVSKGAEGEQLINGIDHAESVLKATDDASKKLHESANAYKEAYTNTRKNIINHVKNGKEEELKKVITDAGGNADDFMKKHWEGRGGLKETATDRARTNSDGSMLASPTEGSVRKAIHDKHDAQRLIDFKTKYNEDAMRTTFSEENMKNMGKSVSEHRANVAKQVNGLDSNKSSLLESKLGGEFGDNFKKQYGVSYNDYVTAIQVKPTNNAFSNTSLGSHMDDALKAEKDLKATGHTLGKEKLPKTNTPTTDTENTPLTEDIKGKYNKLKDWAKANPGKAGLSAAGIGAAGVLGVKAMSGGNNE